MRNRAALDSLLPAMLRRVKASVMSSSIAAALLLLHFVVNLDYRCSCSSDGLEPLFLASHIAFPSLSLVCIAVVTNKPFINFCRKRGCNRKRNPKQDRKCNPKQKRTCNTQSGRIVGKACMNSVFAVMAWIASVLYDGDWYICLQTHENPTRTHIPCTKKEDLSVEEQTLLRQYFNASRACSLGMILAVAILWMVSACCYRCCCHLCCCSSSEHFYEWKYDKYLERETLTALQEKLQGEAQRISREKCKTVLEEISKNLDKAVVTSEVETELKNCWEEISQPDFYWTKKINKKPLKTEGAEGDPAAHKLGRSCSL